MPLRPYTFLATIAALALTAWGAEAAAQMFGPRQLGRPLNPQTPPGLDAPSLEEVAQITGEERYLRENRGLLDFVGRDMRQRNTFVGRTGGTVTGDVRPATEDIVPRRSRNANAEQQQSGRSGGDIYEPRLSLGFNFASAPASLKAQELNRMLNRVQVEHPLGPLSVEIQGRTAILQGEVASESDRQLAEALVVLEPGLSHVVNEIRVVRMMD